jgi:hypothetical protein
LIVDKNAQLACEMIEFSNAADFGEGEAVIAKTAKK